MMISCAACSKDNTPLAELVLRIITGKPDLVLTECQTQKDMKRLAGARSICLDAYGADTAGKKYDMEVQREDKGADPHRARCHSHRAMPSQELSHSGMYAGTYMTDKSKQRSMNQWGPPIRSDPTGCR